MTKALITSNLNDQRIADSLNRNGVGVIPTDTVYGLICLAKNKEAVSRLYSLKERSGKPGTLIASSVEDLAELGLKRRYLKAVEHLWPAAVSVVIPCFGILDYLHLGKQSLAVRIPDYDALRQLAGESGVLQTSSANITAKPEAATLQQAMDYFGDRVDFYVDGGDLSERQPSTIVRVTDDVLEVLREGAVKIDDKGRAVK